MGPVEELDPLKQVGRARAQVTDALNDPGCRDDEDGNELEHRAGLASPERPKGIAFVHVPVEHVGKVARLEGRDGQDLKKNGKARQNKIFFNTLPDVKETYQEADGQNDGPGEGEHRYGPVRQAAGLFDEDGHDALAVVRPAANDENCRYLDDVDDHEPPHGSDDVVQVVHDGRAQLRGQWQAGQEADETGTEGDGRLPGFETAGAEGHDPANDAVPDGQLLGDPKGHQGEVEKDGPKGGELHGTDHGHQGGEQLRGESERGVARAIPRPVIQTVPEVVPPHGDAHHEVVVELSVVVGRPVLRALTHKPEASEEPIAPVRLKRGVRPVVVRPSVVDDLEAGGCEESGQEEDEERHADDDGQVPPECVTVPVVRRDLHDDGSADAPRHEHLPGRNDPDAGVHEELVPRGPVQDAPDPSHGWDPGAVAQDFDADDEVAQEGESPEGVDHLPVRPQTFRNQTEMESELRTAVFSMSIGPIKSLVVL